MKSSPFFRNALLKVVNIVMRETKLVGSARSASSTVSARSPREVSHAQLLAPGEGLTDSHYFLALSETKLSSRTVVCTDI